MQIKNSIRKYKDMFLTALLLLLFFIIKNAMMPFFIGIVLSYVCGPLVKFLHDRFKISLNVSAALCIISIYFILIFFVIKIVPFVYDGLTEIINRIMLFDPTNISQMITFNLDGDYVIEGINAIRNLIISRIPNYLHSLTDTLISSTNSIISITFSIVFAPIISFYFLSSFYFKKNDLTYCRGSIDYINSLAKNFIQVQILMICIYSCCYFILFSLINLNNFITLSIVCGMAYLVPYIGLVMGLMTCILIAIMQYGIDYHILILAIGFIVIAILDTGFISPKVVGSKFGLHPLLTIFSIVVSAHLFGIIGMVFAIPIAVIMRDSANLLFKFMKD
jgi:putative permease